LICVSIMIKWGDRGISGFRQVFLSLLLNPLIIACFFGIIINLLGGIRVDMVITSLDLIGKSAIGVGLISIGASLNLKSLFRPSPLLLVSASLKLLVMPLIGAPLIWYF